MKTNGQVRTLLEAMRCHQWVKNVFVFAAPVFGERILEPRVLVASSLTFLAFSLCASALYLVNDLFDMERDRAHPRKRERPLASGRMTPRLAKQMMLLLGSAGLLMSWAFVSLPTAVIIASYMCLSVLYSRFLKHIVIIDVMVISAGFMLRILAGAAAAEVLPSYWLLLCTLNVSLFLGFVKRRAEIVVLGETASEHRSVLTHYSCAFLDQMISIVTGATLVCYILYTVDDRTSAVFGSRLLVVTVPFVMYGLFRYLYLAYHRDEGDGPTRAILRDRPFLANIVLWALVSGTIVYLGEYLTAHLHM